MSNATRTCPTCRRPVPQPPGGGRRKYCDSACSPGVEIHYLKPGDRVPTSPPRRYPDSSGYIRLRWTVGPYRVVEVREHRVADGVVTAAEHVHHRNHIRDDNRPENLVPLTEAEHQALHGDEWRSGWAEIAQLYTAGMTTPEIARVTGRNMGNVSRILAAQEIKVRPVSHYHPLPTRAELEAAYPLCHSAAALAARLGFSTCTIRRALKTYGFPSYKAGRPKAG